MEKVARFVLMHHVCMCSGREVTACTRRACARRASLLAAAKTARVSVCKMCSDAQYAIVL